MDTYDVMQESELEMFGMDGDWGIEKERAYDHSYDIDPVLDLINTSDMVTPPASPIFVQHSTSTPMVSLPFASQRADSPSNDFYGRSAPETHDISRHSMDPLIPSWAVPTLQYSSFGSSIGTETSFNGYTSDLSMQSAISPSSEFDASPFLRLPNDPQYWLSDNAVARTETNASFDAINEEPSGPTIERSSLSPRPPESSGHAMVHHHSKGRTKTGPGKRSRGRKGPLNPQSRITTHEMRNVGACKACRDRKIKVHNFGLPIGQSTNTPQV
jgi:hypothetical protein